MEQPNPITMTFIEHAVLTSGLKFDTVLDLLRSGWIYTQTVDKPDAWTKRPILYKEE